MAKERIRWCLGEGIIDFWNDRWLLDIPLSQFAKIENPPHFFVAEFVSIRGWNEPRLRDWLPSNLVQMILDTLPHHRERLNDMDCFFNG